MSLTCPWHMLQPKNRPWTFRLGKSIKWPKPACAKGVGSPIDSYDYQMSWICWDGPNLKHSSLLSPAVPSHLSDHVSYLQFGKHSYHMDTRYPSVKQTQSQRHGGGKRTDFGARWILGQPALPLTICVALGSFCSFWASASSARKLLVSLEVRPLDLGLSEQPLLMDT